jgi:two-component system KDP operon response regulator KdpE
MSALEPLVLVIEDEAPMRRFLRAALSARSFRVAEAGTAQEGMVAITASRPDVVLLDLGLPDADGIDVTRGLRGWTDVPIIVLSARGRESDKVAALDAGADDYLTKPFGVDELLARLRVALRRAARDAGIASSPLLEAGPIRVDLDRHEVTCAAARSVSRRSSTGSSFASRATRACPHAPATRQGGLERRGRCPGPSRPRAHGRAPEKDRG